MIEIGYGSNRGTTFYFASCIRCKKSVIETVNCFILKTDFYIRFFTLFFRKIQILTLPS